MYDNLAHLSDDDLENDDVEGDVDDDFSEGDLNDIEDLVLDDFVIPLDDEEEIIEDGGYDIDEDDDGDSLYEEGDNIQFAFSDEEEDVSEDDNGKGYYDNYNL